MVVVNNARQLVGQLVEVTVQSSLQTGAGIIVFADARLPSSTHAAPARTPEP
jgi:uncharacterized protein YacL